MSEIEGVGSWNGDDIGLVHAGGGKFPDLGVMEFRQIRWRLGNQETIEGELAGFILEFWFDALPWFKFRLPLSIANAAEVVRQFHVRLTERGLVDVASEEKADTAD